MSDPGNSPNTFNHRGGGWVVLQSILLLGIVLAGPMDRSPTPVWSFWLGAVLFALGGGIGIAGVLRLERNRTPYPMPRAGSRLITSGIYARMRHPLYTCLVLASLGWTGLFFSRAALILTPALAIFLILKSRREEQFLIRAFPAYENYRQQVAAFIPGLC